MHDHHTGGGDLSFDDKLAKIIHHWMHHNDDHAVNYRDWAEKAEAENHPEVARLLREAAEISEKQNLIFEKAGAAVKNKG